MIIDVKVEELKQNNLPTVPALNCVVLAIIVMFHVREFFLSATATC